MFAVWRLDVGQGSECVSVCPSVYSELCVCVPCPAVYLLAHLNVCVHSSFFSSHPACCPAPQSPCKSLKYFHSTVSGLIFTLISWLDSAAYTSHTSSAMFTTRRAKAKCVKMELAKIKSPVLMLNIIHLLEAKIKYGTVLQCTYLVRYQ